MKQFKIPFYFLAILLLMNLSGCNPELPVDPDNGGTGISADAAAVAADIAALDESDFTFASGDSRNSVSGDFNLPTSGSSGTIITWSEKQDTGDNVSVNAGTVTVTRPAAGSSDAEVILTAAVSMGSESATVDFTFTIKHIPDDEAVAEAIANLTTDNFTFSGSEKANAVKSNFTLPPTDSNGNTITWSETADTGNNISIAGNTVTVTRPGASSANKSVTITAEITSGTITDTKDFTIRILADYMSGVTFSTNVSSYSYVTPTENSNARLFSLADSARSQAVAIIGDYAYVSYNYSAQNHPVYIFNISDPSDPTAIGYFAFNTQINTMSLTGDYLYAAGNYTVYPIDVSDPANPEVLRPVNLTSSVIISITDTIIEAGTLFYGGSYDSSESTIGSLDISNPAEPVSLDYIRPSGRFFQFSYSNGYLYAANGWTADKTVAIIDVTDPANMNQIYLGDLDGNAEYVKGVAVYGDYLFYPYGSIIKVADISNPSEPVYVKTLSLSGASGFQQLHISGNRLYGVNGGNCTVSRADISNIPTIGSLSAVTYGKVLSGSPLTGNDLAISGGYLFLAGAYYNDNSFNGFVIMPDN